MVNYGIVLWCVSSQVRIPIDQRSSKSRRRHPQVVRGVTCTWFRRGCSLPLSGDACRQWRAVSGNARQSSRSLLGSATVWPASSRVASHGEHNRALRLTCTREKFRPFIKKLFHKADSEPYVNCLWMKFIAAAILRVV